MTLEKFVKTFPGSAFPSLVETTDGNRCVLKMRGAGNGASSLLAEFVVNRAAALAGWPVPDTLRKVWAIDALFCNYDRTALSRNVLRDEAGTKWLVDHGSCLFLQTSLPFSRLIDALRARANAPKT